MRNKSILFLISTVVLLANACGGAQDAAETGPDGVPGGIIPEMADVGPNEARIYGTVTARYNERSAGTSDPCSRAPCMATVRIDSVLGYGSSFPQPLSRGQHVDVRFAFTLEPTDEVDVNVDTSYPGLQSGQSFWANVRSRPAPGSDRSSYVVYGYHPADE